MDTARARVNTLRPRARAWAGRGRAGLLKGAAGDRGVGAARRRGLARAMEEVGLPVWGLGGEMGMTVRAAGPLGAGNYFTF